MATPLRHHYDPDWNLDCALGAGFLALSVLIITVGAALQICSLHLGI